MATLNRKYLKALGVDEDKIDAIIEAHTDVTSALVSERDRYKAEAESVEALTKERDELKEQVTKSKADGAAEVQAEFDSYKKQVETEKLNAAKEGAVKAALKAAGVGREDFVELLIGKVNLSEIKADNGVVKDTKWIDQLKTSYAGCFGTTSDRGADGLNPPSSGSQAMTKEAFYKLSLADQMSYANEHPSEWAEFSK